MPFISDFSVEKFLSVSWTKYISIFFCYLEWFFFGTGGKKQSGINQPFPRD